MHWLREYGESDRRLETAALATFMLLAMLYYIVTSGIAEVSHTQSQIAGSLYLPNIRSVSYTHLTLPTIYSV